MRRLLAACVAVILSTSAAFALVRIKDITYPQGPRDYQLVGYGLVVGLQGTGDTLRNSPFTEQSISAMLDRMGVNVRPQTAGMRTRNMAAVMVTTSLPPFMNWGSTLDVTVSSMGDATSLMGGTLVLTSLSGVDGQVYAIAQGPIAVSGFAATGQNETLTHGVATVGRIPNGATIEREPPRPITEDQSLVLQLRNPDYTTSIHIADAVNEFTRQRYKATSARERDDHSVALRLPKGCHATRFLAEIGDLKIEVETPARVVIDERTGTVVIGEDVQISRVAVTHGALTIRITETPEVSQPAPFSNGRTVVTNQTTINASQQEAKVAVLAGPTLKQLVRGLNQVGLRPTGIISILQAIKTAGALQADLVIQ